MNNLIKIYEDEQVLVICKQAGLQMHSDGRGGRETLADILLEEYPELAEVGEKGQAQNGEEIIRPGMVHRLDRDTSGILIVAKTSDAHAFLKQQFQSRSVEKVYHAFVYGHMSDEEGVIDKAIGRSPKDFRRYSAQPGAKGTLREARTDWIVRGVSEIEGEKISLLELTPKTGRTHQIRVHLKAIHHPIVCDPLYAAGRPCMLSFSRQALHAHKLSLKLPSGEWKEFEAPYPQDFETALSLFTGE